jgi:PAS domain S-box-containing protein
LFTGEPLVLTHSQSDKVVVDLADLAPSNKKSVIRVLHVDDDPSLQEITKLMLLDLDSSFEIDCACCVDEAFKKLETGHYDVVVSDYEMPQKDGLQFLKELREGKNNIPFTLFTGKGREEVAIEALNLGADAYHNKQGSPETVYGELSHSIRQSVERKKAQASILLSEMQLQCMLDINKMLDASDKELIDFALEAIVKTTQSEFAFIDLIDTDETVMTIYSWSKTAMKECQVLLKPIHYPVSEVGIWAEPIRQRKPVIIDDYSVAMPHKKGCPKGHVEIKNFLGVPVFEKEHIVAIAAVANKKGHYDEKDVGYVTSLLTDMWRLIQRKKSTELLDGSESKYRTLVEKSLQGILVTKVAPLRLVFANDAMGKILNYSLHELLSLSPQGIMGLVYHEDRAVFFKRMESRLQGEEPESFHEFRAVRKDGSVIWMNALANRIEFEGQPAVQGVFLDINDRKKTENALQKSEERFRQVSENAEEWLWEVDSNGLYTYSSSAMEKLLGYKPEEIVGKKHFYDLFAAEEQEELKKAAFGAFAIKNSFRGFLNRNVHKNGNIVWLSTSGVPILDEKGDLLGYRGVDTDITKRLEMENTLKESEERFRRQFEEALDPIFVADVQTGIVVDCNRAACELVGRERPELVGVHQRVLHPSEEVEGQFSRSFQRQINQKEGQVLEGKVITKSGEIKNVQISANPFTLGNKTLIRASFRDITEYKKTQQSLLESEEKFRNLAEESPNMIFINHKGRVVYVNKKCEETMGYSKENFYSADFNFLSLISPDYVEALKSNFDRHMRGEEVSPYEYVLITREGERINAIITTKLIKYENERALLGIVTDITDRKTAEMVLLENEGRLRTYLDSIQTGLLLIDPATHIILDANAATEKMFSASKTSIVGSICHKFVCPAEKESCAITDLGKTIDHSERTFIKANGETLPILKTVTPITLDGQKLLLESFVDITELTQTRMALESSEKKYREFAESLPEIVFEIDSEGTLVFVNHIASQITGYSLDEFGKNFSFIRLIVPDEIENALVNITKLLSGESGLFGEFHIIRKDGSVFPAMVWANPILVQNKFAGLRGIVADISENKRAEETLKRAAEDFQVLTEKLRVVGSLTRHDVGNKLMAVKSNLYLLKKQIGDNPKITKYLEGIDAAINQSDEIFEFSRLYEKIGAEKPSSMDVFECFNVAAAMFSNLRTVKIINECQGLQVMADSLLRQLFYNFIDNSLKHGEKVTQIRLHLNKNEYEVNLFYEDNGVGVSKDNKQKIFDQGFTTGKGSGLGLHLIKKMIEVYGWTIEENGEPGKGAKFTITIPASKVSVSNKRAGA